MLRNFSEKEAVRNFLGNLHVHPDGKSLPPYIPIVISVNAKIGDKLREHLWKTIMPENFSCIDVSVATTSCRKELCSSTSRKGQKGKTAQYHQQHQH